MGNIREQPARKVLPAEFFEEESNDKSQDCGEHPIVQAERH
jgi:hypothetical protein